MKAGLTIGEFSGLTHLSVRTLRHYHRLGVLQPARVDPSTGYRYYTAEQIPAAQIVHRLRQLDLPLPRIKAIMATEDPGGRHELVSAHLRQLQAELDRTRAAVVALQHLLAPEAHDLAVELRSVPARTVAAVIGHVTRAEVTRWYDAAMASLDAAVPPTQRLGPPAGRYANELFTADRGDAMVYYPVAPTTVLPQSPGSRSPGSRSPGSRSPGSQSPGSQSPGSRSPGSRSPGAASVELPPVELAVATHRGPHDDIAETYGRLGRWVVEHALAIDGPVHETYAVGPRDTTDEAAWCTEIGWPIFRLTPG